RREGADVQRDGAAGARRRGDPGRREGLRREAVPAEPRAGGDHARAGVSVARTSASSRERYAALFATESRAQLGAAARAVASLAGHAVDVAADVETLALFASGAPAAASVSAEALALAPLAGAPVVHVRISPDSALPGARAAILVRRLAALGTIDSCVPDADSL